MNWEAFLAIGGVTVILGAVLLLPGLIWARRKAKQHPETHASMSVTKAGYIYIGAVLFVLFSGLTSSHWMPQSSLGQWTATTSGRFLFGAVVVGAAFLVERILGAVGIELKVLSKK